MDTEYGTYSVSIVFIYEKSLQNQSINWSQILSWVVN